MQYRDKVEYAKAEIKNLKAQGAEMIIALTHMREYNDRAFLENVPEVDLLLGMCCERALLYSSSSAMLILLPVSALLALLLGLSFRSQVSPHPPSFH